MKPSNQESNKMCIAKFVLDIFTRPKETREIIKIAIENLPRISSSRIMLDAKTMTEVANAMIDNCVISRSNGIACLAKSEIIEDFT